MNRRHQIRVSKGGPARDILGRWTAIQLFISVALLALGVLGGSYQPARIALVASIIPSALAIFRAGKRFDYFQAIATICIVAIWLSATVSMLWTPEPSISINHYVVLHVNLSAILVSIAVPPKKATLTWLILAWTIALLITIPFALFEIGTGSHFISTFDERLVRGGIGTLPFASVFLGNPNNYSLFLCICIPFLVTTIFSVGRIYQKLVLSTALAASVFVLLVNSSRISIFFVFVCIVYYAVVARKIFFIVVVGGISFAAASYYALLNPDEFYRILSFLELKFALLETSRSQEERFFIIEPALSVLKETFGFGGGLGSLEHKLATEYLQLIPNPHNLLAEFVTNLGILPTVLFSWLLIRILLLAFRVRKNNQAADAIVLLITMTPVLGTINSLAFGYTYWWLLFGTFVAFARVTTHGDRENALGKLNAGSVRHVLPQRQYTRVP